METKDFNMQIERTKLFFDAIRFPSNTARPYNIFYKKKLLGNILI